MSTPTLNHSPPSLRARYPRFFAATNIGHCALPVHCAQRPRRSSSIRDSEKPSGRLGAAGGAASRQKTRPQASQRKWVCAACSLLLAAEKQAPGNANLAYNIGLLQVDLKRYDAALEHAHSAYLGGFPLPGLRDKLKRAGAWRDPAPLADAKPAVATPPADSVAKPAPAAADTPPVPADKADKAVAATVAAPEQRPADAAAAPKP